MTRQPFLHDADVVLRAPGQTWSRRDGDLREPIDGVHVADVRVLRGALLTVAESAVEHVGTDRLAADHVVFHALLRGLDDPAAADPRVRLDRHRTAAPDGVAESIVLTSGRDVPLEAEVVLTVRPDVTPMASVKAGDSLPSPAVRTTEQGLAWSAADVDVLLTADGMRAEVRDEGVRLVWRTVLPPHGRAEAAWRVRAVVRGAVVAAPPRPVPLPAARTDRADLDRWLERALGDLEALQLVLPDRPRDVFLGAGAPWFLTLFGRDSIWAARLLLPVDVRLAEGTLRVLARLQGTVTDAATGERPGGILHELRRGENALADGVVLPPRYYGTIDATPLWILLLHDARRAGLADEVVRELLPHLRAALAWLRDAVPAGGFLSYHDASGHGLANQGWKDSGDSVQWADGRLADGPIALCEVQGYAHEAALAGARLLRAAEGSDAEQEARGWEAWAGDLRRRFRDAFWVDDADGGHPAIALDRDGRAVDSLTSNIGHLLGTGLLDAVDEARIAALLVDPRLDAGSGLRTLSTDAAGYWPLSYHGGAVWAHDTAIAVRGLLATGHVDEARTLAEGLLAASRAFDGRMPELHGGDPAGAGSPVPYPAACRPQAWSAAAAVVVRDAVASPPPNPVPVPEPARAAG